MSYRPGIGLVLKIFMRRLCKIAMLNRRPPNAPSAQLQEPPRIRIICHNRVSRKFRTWYIAWKPYLLWELWTKIWTRVSQLVILKVETKNSWYNFHTWPWHVLKKKQEIRFWHDFICRAVFIKKWRFLQLYWPLDGLFENKCTRGS